MTKDNLIKIINTIQKHTLNCSVCSTITADAIFKLYNEEIKSLKDEIYKLKIDLMLYKK